MSALPPIVSDAECCDQRWDWNDEGRGPHAWANDAYGHHTPLEVCLYCGGRKS